MGSTDGVIKITEKHTPIMTPSIKNPKLQTKDF